MTDQLKNSSGEMPYERFLSCGAGSLTNAELLGIIIRTGTKGVSAVDLAKEILGIHDPDADSLSALKQLTMEELRAIHGIGEVKAVKLLCLICFLHLGDLIDVVFFNDLHQLNCKVCGDQIENWTHAITPQLKRPIANTQ